MDADALFRALKPSNMIFKKSIGIRCSLSSKFRTTLHTEQTMTEEERRAGKANYKNVSNLNSINLSSPHIPNSVSLLKQGCMDSGFCYVTNHGIAEELMDEVFAESKKFFDLPLEDKKVMTDVFHGWRQTMEKYHQQALEVVRKIAWLVALSLDLDANFFERPKILGKPIAIFRLLHYEG
ncbi:hypothetical protein L1887_35207 [Cichorium endivia]|nr:hypothetical protein L1887_35207 [Cichorium endivia]